MNIIYIGRPGPWGNPFVVGRDGTRQDVVNLFEAYLVAKNYRPAVMSLRQSELVTKFQWMRDHIQELDGKELFCPGCRGTSPCHGDILKRYLAEENGDDDDLNA
jgi:hypothetical protein